MLLLRSVVYKRSLANLSAPLYDPSGTDVPRLYPAG